MKPRIKYPLTAIAKEAAKRLVELWEQGRLNQHFTLIDITTGASRLLETNIAFGRMDDKPIEIPELSLLLELSQFHLIEVSPRTTFHVKGWDILLTQELRNAVASDFEVSDYFLTTQAVGTIVLAEQGGTISFNSPFQSAATNFGDIQQTVETPKELADTLTNMLGQDFLKANVQLTTAINELKDATQANKEGKVGRVISELGHCIVYGANTAVVIQALIAVAPVLQKLIGA